MRTILSVGSSTQREYCFTVVLGALLWRDLVGFEPRIFLIGTEDEWMSKATTRASLSALRYHKIRHIFVPRIDDYLDATIAQSVRYHVACDPSIPDDQFISMSDADLIPLARDFYHQHDDSKAKCISYYSNGDHFISKEDVLSKFESGVGFQSIPTCHVVMRAKEWRSSYNLTPNNLVGSVKHTLDGYLRPRMSKAEALKQDVGFEVWMSDQRVLTHHLCAQPWFPTEVQFIERAGHPPADRLDRSHKNDWLGTFDPSRWSDAHVHHPADSDEHWPTVLPIIETLLPQHAAWARLYREVFVR